MRAQRSGVDDACWPYTDISTECVMQSSTRQRRRAHVVGESKPVTRKEMDVASDELGRLGAVEDVTLECEPASEGD